MTNDFAKLNAETPESSLAQVAFDELAGIMRDEMAREMDFNPGEFESVTE